MRASLFFRRRILDARKAAQSAGYDNQAPHLRAGSVTPTAITGAASNRAAAKPIHRILRKCPQATRGWISATKVSEPQMVHG
jgi:hypothetical protein